jgi:NitT/TauT family transport system substrate-binding protein
MRKEMVAALGILIALSMLLTACQQATPEPTGISGPTAAEGTTVQEPTAVEPVPTQPPRPVTIAVGTYTLTVNYYYLMMPQVLGYWRDMGYEVTVEPVGASLDAIQQLVGGNADFVNVGSGAVVQANVQEDISLRVVDELGTVDWGLVVPVDSDIETLADFKGKTIGVYSLASSGLPYLTAYLAENGLDPDNDVSLIPVGYGPQASEALNRGDVDALMLWNSALAELENLGHEFRYFRAEMWRNMPDWALATTEEIIANDRQMVVDIVKGMVMAAVFTQANPGCVLQLHWANWPETKPSGVDDETAHAWDMHLLNAEMDAGPAWAFEMHGSDLLAIATPEEFGRLQDFLLAAGLITVEDDPASFIINDPTFWQEVNDFDHEQIVQSAQACDY